MYNIKVYEKDGTTLKQTIQIEKLESIWTFTAQVDWGFWILKFWLAYKITDTSIEASDIVKVQYKAAIIYTWAVLNVKKVYWATKEIIQVNLRGLWSVMTTLLTTSTFAFHARQVNTVCKGIR